MKLLLALMIAFVSLVPALAQEVSDDVVATGPARPPLRERLFFGGGIGLGFGDVDYIEVSPHVGVRVTERFSAGAGVLYRHRNDSRFEPKLKTDDYGVNLFARHRVVGPMFLTAEYEYLDYEYLRGDLTTDRTSLSSLLAGAGAYQSFGPFAGGFVAVLYNFSYDEDDLGSPYDEPWVYRAGVSFGF